DTRPGRRQGRRAAAGTAAAGGQGAVAADGVRAGPGGLAGRLRGARRLVAALAARLGRGPGPVLATGGRRAGRVATDAGLSADGLAPQRNDDDGRRRRRGPAAAGGEQSAAVATDPRTERAAEAVLDP